MMLRQKEPRQHDPAHLAFVRSQPCSVCGSTRMIEAAHVRYACLPIGKETTGMQEKPSDCWTVSLCAYHHRTGILAQHKMNEAEFWIMHGRNPFEIAARLWIESGGATRATERAENPKRVKPRKIEARKPSEQRVKIHGRATFQPGRKLQSRNTFERRP